jgi:Kef-type K+ transport system membrane component KefB
MDIDSILLAGTVMLTATVVVGSVVQKLHLGSIVALLVVGMALGPYS